MITKDIIQDYRLSPLFDADSNLLLQLFVLEIKNTITNEAQYKIVYGWCIKSTNPLSQKVLFGSSADVVYTADSTTYSFYRLSLYNNPNMIVDVVNSLVSGKSLKTTCANLQIDASKVNFDVKYVEDDDFRKKNIVLRPLIYNETNTLLTRNFYEKYSLTSPFKNCPSVSLIINNLNKIDLLKNASGFYDSWKEALLSILKYLGQETTMPFDSSGSGRFGNIEFINSQCSTEFENHFVWFENMSEIVNIEGTQRSASKKVIVTIQPNVYTCEKNVMVNCFLTNGGQVIFDECKEAFHKDGEDLKVIFNSAEQITQIAISVWIKTSETYTIWYKHSVPLIRNISTNMGMVGTTGVVKSEWLDVIEKSNRKTKTQVEEAQKISRASYSKISTENYSLDPWVSSDASFSKLVAELNPPNSESAFFPKGWDVSAGEHGALSFLEWFKKITEHANKVIIQDPFFDTLGLEFLARTPNSNTEFSILTCTQVNSSDDDTDQSDQEHMEPNRAIRLKKFVEAYPSLFLTLNFNIYDLRSTGGGDKNLLHDRYMLIFSNNVLVKGFHLSNSIQGATKHHPLLITSIPIDVLNKVNNHLAGIIENTEKSSDVKLLSLIEKPKFENAIKKDEEVVPLLELLQELKSRFKSEKDITESNVSFIIDYLEKSESDQFLDAWTTCGYFIANVGYHETLIEHLISKFTPGLKGKLQFFLRQIVQSSPKTEFRDDQPFLRFPYSASIDGTFNDSLEEVLRLDNHISGFHSFTHWGAYYAIKILYLSDFDKFLETVHATHLDMKAQTKGDSSKSPHIKLLTLLFDRLVQKFFWMPQLDYISKGLSSPIIYVRAISVASLIINTTRKEQKYDLATSISLIKGLSVDEALSSLCQILFKHKLRNDKINPDVESGVFQAIVQLLSDNYTSERLKKVFSYLFERSYTLIEKKITEEIFLKLEEKGLISFNEIFKMWSNQFLQTLSDFKSYESYSGLQDLVGWSFNYADKKEQEDFIKVLEKKFKSETNVIRKPFNKSSNSWDNSFERLSFIQTVMSISALYSISNSGELSCKDKIKSLIDQAETLKTQFQPNLFRSKVFSFANEIVGKLINKKFLDV